MFFKDPGVRIINASSYIPLFEIGKIKFKSYGLGKDTSSRVVIELMILVE